MQQAANQGAGKLQCQENIKHRRRVPTMMQLQQRFQSATKWTQAKATSRWKIFFFILTLGQCDAFVCRKRLQNHNPNCNLLSKIPTSRRHGEHPFSSIFLGREDSNLPTASTSASCVELIEPETGCQVVLLGCFHGTISSAKDVEYLINESTTDVVALELCATRYADLRREEEKQMQGDSTLFGNGDRESSPWLSRYFRMVSRTIEKRGLSTGLAAAVLGGVSGLQTALSGFTPGLEFTTALKCSSVQEKGACDIVLADRDVDETLRRLGSLPQITADMLLREPVKSISRYSRVLRQALFGDDELLPDHQVQLSKVLTRNLGAIQDLARLTVPPLLLIQLVASLLTHFLYAMQDGEIVDTMSSMTALGMSASQVVDSSMQLVPSTTIDTLSDVLADTVPHVIASSAIMFLSYVLIVLPTVRVILDERDDILGDGIMAACRLAASKQQQQDSLLEGGDDSCSRPGRVVAVLGLLHVNGVAQRLLSSSVDLSESEAGAITR